MGTENPNKSENTEPNLPPKDGEQINDNKGKDEGSSSTPPAPSKSDKGFREQQSRADRTAAELEAANERLDELENTLLLQQRDGDIKAFIKENGSKYPDVTVEDLDRFALSHDDLEETAKYLQGRHEKIKQDTLANAREVPDDSISDEEYEKEAKKLQESSDPSRFEKWLRLKNRKRK